LCFVIALIKDKRKEHEKMETEERMKEQTMIEMFVMPEMRKFFRKLEKTDISDESLKFAINYFCDEPDYHFTLQNATDNKEHIIELVSTGLFIAEWYPYQHLGPGQYWEQEMTWGLWVHANVEPLIVRLLKVWNFKRKTFGERKIGNL
jgi:hypothetical protein